MTSPETPVGACGDAAPTGDTHPAHHRNGYDSVTIDTLRYQRDELIRIVEVMLSALDGGSQWEIDTARHLASRALDYLKDKP